MDGKGSGLDDPALPHDFHRPLALFSAAFAPRINACSSDLSDLAGSVNSITWEGERRDGPPLMRNQRLAHAVPGVF